MAALSTKRGGTEAMAAELEGQGLKVLSVEADVGDALSVDAAVERVLRELGPVDVLVNNAGIVRRVPLVEMTDADFDDVLRVNLSGPFYFARRIAPQMVARRQGRIINVSSISGTLGSPKMSGYCASKWGLNGLTQALSEELKESGVFVAAVMPGSVDTRMLEGSGFAPKMSPEEVARVVRFLATEAPFAMTGSLVEVFG